METRIRHKSKYSLGEYIYLKSWFWFGRIVCAGKGVDFLMLRFSKRSNIRVFGAFWLTHMLRGSSACIFPYLSFPDFAPAPQSCRVTQCPGNFLVCQLHASVFGLWFFSSRFFCFFFLLLVTTTWTYFSTKRERLMLDWRWKTNIIQFHTISIFAREDPTPSRYVHVI